jgi:hypothetical protein
LEITPLQILIVEGEACLLQGFPETFQAILTSR